MKRFVSLIFLLLLAAALFSACGEKKPENAGNVEDKPVSMYDLRSAMCAADESLPAMLYASSSDSDPADLFANISDVDYEKIDDFFVAYADDGKAYEIAVARAKDEADVNEIKDSFLAHVAERVNTYSYYMPDQKAKAEAAMVFTSGRYAVLIMCDNADAVKTAFDDFVK